MFGFIGFIVLCLFKRKIFSQSPVKTIGFSIYPLAEFRKNAYISQNVYDVNEVKANVIDH